MHRRPRPGAAALLAACASLIGPAHSAPGADTPPYRPEIRPASDEGEKAIRRFRVEPGLKLSLFASEPTLANPVAFAFDARGRVFVAETFRLHHGVSDVRGHMHWLDADLACRTVADRDAMYHRFLGKDYATWATEHDRIRLIEDADGDGRADRSTVFADGFKDGPVGLGAGLLARKGDLYYTNIPDLWRLRDRDGDGRADEKDALSTGYGVHVGFLGHDLHGLKMGPDGRVYFSIGDRGINVRQGGTHLFYPDMGTVLRCEPDGSRLEVVSTGLRNPQELAFDERGDLFTVDNNSDGGDKARLVHLVEGSDSGWRIGWQFIEAPNSRGPWNAERMWDPAFDGRPAFVLPPLANLSDGPSGLAYNPGTALNDSFKSTFFLCDFRGSAGNSGIRSFKLTPKGASYELGENKEFLWSLLATDVDFGPDGALYATDWVDGWEQPGKGRIYKLDDPAHASDPIRVEVRKALAEGFESRGIAELANLLGHADARVRQEAQFELAARAIRTMKTLRDGGRVDDPDAIRAMTTLIESAGRGPIAARRHATWGLGQVDRTHAELTPRLLVLAVDPDAEVRFQAARVLADSAGSKARPADAPWPKVYRETFLLGLRDADPRVRFHAALGLGKVGDRESAGAVLSMIRENDGRDPYLAHAGIMALVGIGDAAGLRSAAKDPSAAVRMAVLLADRRLMLTQIAGFLGDPDPRLVVEAARAVNDLSIPGAMLLLADMVTRPDLPEPLGRRVIDANLQMRDGYNCRNLAALARRPEVAESLRSEALDVLAGWAEPSGRDRVTGLWHPLPSRGIADAANALRPVLDDLLRGTPEPVRQAAARAAGSLKIAEGAPMLAALVGDPKASAETQVEALKALGAIGGASASDGVSKALASPLPTVRAAGQTLLAGLNPSEAIPVLDRVLDSGSTPERQAAFATLGGLDAPAASAVLARRLGQYAAGTLAPEVRLDLLEAAARKDDPAVRAGLARVDDVAASGPLHAYRDTLVGGDAARGLKVFREKAAAECLRCHKFRGDGGEVGPELAGLGGRKPREYILESIVEPNAQIAQGFETVVLALADGTVATGVLRSETDKELRLVTAEGKPLVVPKSSVEERNRGSSAMPADTITKLTKPELRDLVEWLSTSK